MREVNFQIALRAALLAAGAIAPLSAATAAPQLVIAAAAAAEAAQPTGNANDPVSGANTNPPESQSEEDKTIVVTGTLIRNTAPTGTNPISVTTADIEATGATSASEVLASIPQITGSFFNNIPQVLAINATALPPANQTTARPSLRPNPFGGTDSGNATLILIDGVRQAGIGVNGSSANPDSVPPALIQRVDVNPDGASSIYGSDAIGGVINFITRRKFDGIQIGGSVGLRSNYTAWEGNVTAGKDWGSGGAYIGYSYSSNDLLLNREVDYYNPLDFSTGLRRDLSCPSPNVRIGTGATARYYPVSGGAVGTNYFMTNLPAGQQAVAPNVCSLGLDGSLASANTRHHVLARFTQDLSDSVTVGVRARYINEKQFGLTSPSTFSVTVNNTNPFFQTLADAPGTVDDSTTTSYTILGSFGALQSEAKRRYQNTAEQYGVMADLSWTFGKWRMLAIANFDWSNSSYSNPGLNSTVVTNASNSTLGGNPSTCTLAPSSTNCINFFNISAPSNQALINSALDYYVIGKGSDRIANFRVVFDGPVFELPGGEVKVAIGAEYLRDTFRKGILSGTNPAALTQSEVTQINKAVFGEINVPIFSDSNSIPLFHSLSLNAQGRYDHFSDFGGTFNPRLGASWSPIEGVSFRGNWGKTFRAPTTVDLLGKARANTSATSSAANVFFGFLLKPEDLSSGLVPNSARALILNGTNPSIGPQRGVNWSVGVDLTPISNLKASVTYYKIFFKDLLAQPFNGTPVFPNLAFLTNLCPGGPAGPYGCTNQQITDFLAQAGVINTGVFNNSDVYGLYDSRVTNLGNARVSGLDWSIQYTHPTSWGSIFGSLNGALLLSSESQALPGQPYINNLAPGNQAGTQSFGRSLHRISGRLGATYDNVRAQLTWNHNSGYSLTPSATILQDHVNAFDVFNLFFAYEFKGEGLQSGLKLTLNVDNVFNTSPPEYRTTNSENGYINGSTLGRIFKLGFEKKF